MYTRIFKNRVDLYKNNGQIVRRFNTAAEVVNAQISGPDENPIIAISMKDGKFVQYRADGRFMRAG